MRTFSNTGVENVFGKNQKWKGPKASLKGGAEAHQMPEKVHGIRIDDHKTHAAAAGGGEHGGENTWIYSFADLIMNLLMFFVMMFAISSVDKNKLSQIKEAFSHVSKGQDGKTGGTSKAGTSDGSLTSGWSASNNLSNAEILEKVNELVSKIDSRFLNAKSRQSFEMNQLEEVIRRLKKIVALEWRDEPEKQSFELYIPEGKLFTAGGTRMTSAGMELIAKLGRELKQFDRQLKVQVLSYTGLTSDEAAFALTTNRAAHIASQLKKNILSPKLKHVFFAAGLGTIDTITANKKMVGSDPVVIRVAIRPTGGEQ